MDSNFIIENFIEMLYNNSMNLAARNEYNMNALVQNDLIFDYLKEYLQNQTISEFAMTVNM